MAQELSALSSHGEVKVTFVPHLAPMTRGILGTHYATLKSEVSHDEATAIYRDFYAGEPFVRVVASGSRLPRRHGAATTS